MSESDETVTLGGFLREKAFNMRRWLREELRDETLLSVMDHMLVSQFVELGDQMVASKHHINFRDLHSLLREAAGTPLFDIGRRVRDREDLHPKFWRYLDLFVSVMETATTFQPEQ